MFPEDSENDLLIISIKHLMENGEGGFVFQVEDETGHKKLAGNGQEDSDILGVVDDRHLFHLVIRHVGQCVLTVKSLLQEADFFLESFGADIGYAFPGKFHILKVAVSYISQSQLWDARAEQNKYEGGSQGQRDEQGRDDSPHMFKLTEKQADDSDDADKPDTIPKQQFFQPLSVRVCADVKRFQSLFLPAQADFWLVEFFQIVDQRRFGISVKTDLFFQVFYFGFFLV